MRARDRATALDVDVTHHLVPRHQLARRDGAAVDEEARHGRLHVVHLDDGPARSRDATVVAELAACFGVEGRAVEHDLDVLALARDGHHRAVAEDAGDDTLCRGLDVAGEAGGATGLEDLAVRRHGGDARLAGSRVGLGALALLGHQAPESRLVDVEALLARHLQSEVEGEAIGVVQGEGLLAGEDARAIAAHLGSRHVEDLSPGLQRLQEGRLLLHGDAADATRLVIELGVLRRHRGDRRAHEFADRRLLTAQDAHIADDPAHEASKDVATAFVARDHAVADEERAGSGVVGDDAQGDIGLLTRSVGHARQVAGAIEDALRRIDLVDVLDALQQSGHALQAHAGVDVLGRQRLEDIEVLLGPHRGELLLHEDEVPHLEVAVLVDDRSAFKPVRRTSVVVDLRARPARTGHAHGPVVVLGAAALDALARDSDLLVPDVGGLVVVVVDRDPEPVLGEAVPAIGDAAREQLPREGDGAFFEVVAEGEVARHLEEGSMAGGLADLFDIEGAHALLHARRARVGRRGLTEEVGLEGHHAGVDEEQRRVIEEQ